MKQKISTVKPITETVSDLDALFVAVYNLLYEKLDTEPNKGIVVSKGNPNQRKVTWKKVMQIAHMLEDFFIMREQRTGNNICDCCDHWKCISEASPHIGVCTKYNKNHMHKFNSCKKGFTHKEG